jgi:hypothetical protein
MFVYHAAKKAIMHLKPKIKHIFSWHPFGISLNMKRFTHLLSRFPLELVIWIGSIFAILALDPMGEAHVSLCPLDQLGLDWCPGCGLGRSMNLLAHGEIQASWSMHPLAMFAFVVIFSRIWTLIKNLKTTYNYG